MRYSVLAGAAFALAAASTCALGPRADKLTRNGGVNWEKGNVYATGLGAVPTDERNEAKAYLKARGFARLDALRNLLGTVKHVRIDSLTTGADFETQSDVIRAEIQGIVKGAEVISERTIKVGRNQMVEVTVATPLYGAKGIARVYMRELARRPKSAVAPDIKVQVLRAPPVILKERVDRSEAPMRYSGVIIDCTGLGVERSMAPKIRRQDGSEVWGSVDADPDYVIEHGVVAYARTMKEARENPRVGDRPLVIRAVGRAGGAFNSDAVVTDSDAELLLRSSDVSKFLEGFKVVFVVDPRR